MHCLGTIYQTKRVNMDFFFFRESVINLHAILKTHY